MHPFAPFIQILGKGRHGSRSLTQEEARAAFGMILDGQASPEQVGAFLMLIRVREESPEEAAGFVAAVRERIAVPEGIPVPAIDWGSYAGKRRHLPWFLLAARLLAQNGLPVFMHGTEGESGERLYTHAALAALGLSASASFTEVGDRLTASGFAFLSLEDFAPGLKRLIQLRDLLGLRSPVHSVARMLNPLGAPLSVHGIFHRGYERIHQQAAILLREPGVVVFKGEGGEAEINPEMPTTVFLSRVGRGETLDLPPLFTRRQLKPERLDPAHLKAVWEGEAFDRYGEVAVCGTVAVVLRALGRAGAVEDALALAHAWWQSR